MLPTALLLVTALQAQTPAAPSPATPEDPPSAAERAAQAAERAAQAAERAAEASARMAAATERLAAALERLPPAAPAGAAAPRSAAEAEAHKKAPVWTGTVGLGLIALSGNASTLTFNGLASAERKTERWIYSAKAFGVYGRSRPQPAEGEAVAESQVVALSAGLQVRGDRRFTEVVSGYLLVGAETDHVKSVESRGIGEAGMGILWWDEKEPNGRISSLRTDLAFRYLNETRFQYYPTRLDLPDVDLGGPRLGAELRYGLSKDVVFTEEAEVVPNILGESRVLFTSRSKLLAGLTDSLSIGAAFLVQFDSAPPPGKVGTDTSLSVSLEVAF
jgi:putative salt-induced outer membrane protein YdiY